MLVYPKDIAENYYARRPVLSLAYIGTALHQKNHQVELMDMRVKGYDDNYFKKCVKEFKPDIIGYTMIALSLDQAYSLMKWVKQFNPKILNICGGPEVTLLPKKVLKKDHVDFIISGEGEYSLPELIECLTEKKDYSSIYGLGYKKDGEIHHRTAKTINNLDKLPFPDFDLFDLKKYRNKTSQIKWPIMTSRGCPIKVIKLFDNKTGKLVKLRSEFNVNETHHDKRNDDPFDGKEIN